MQDVAGYAVKLGRLAQLVRAPALQAGGRRFESYIAHHRAPRLVGRRPNEGPHKRSVWMALALVSVNRELVLMSLDIQYESEHERVG